MRKTISILIPFLIFGCATPPTPEISPVERRQRDNAVGLDLARAFEAQQQFKTEPVLTHYLEQLSASLGRSVPELGQTPAKVALLAAKGPAARWTHYALPGNRIYLSTSILRDVRFENELAAILALELGHILKRSAVSRLPEGEGATAPDFLGPSGIFAYSEEQLIAALSPALDMLYAAGFDPRGMATLMIRYRDVPTRSPYPPGIAAKLLENTRRIIALQAPLRNPIVRSEKFLALQKRMRKL
ncbi:MAG: M48 family metalloprotease [Oligoflexia bacterium]|nr:M48 family metalloprotease [Oligoflexia bacterium]